ncbi:hypothetical protein MN116_002745 [Schistosoma mekongi]|uniref:Uncharacterized protein n=1 Tax=Schistosoma mekongi TaxID=38744 RepID=A0AAE2D6I0_SCHME|nr:hypothetical protein MN116_002745 [Schistosoma mekongi]
MELFQQFLLTEEILNKIISEVKEHTKATFKEVSSALGDTEISVDVDAITEKSENKDEETVLLVSKPVLNQKRKVKTSIHSTRCEHSPLNRSKVNEKADAYKSPTKLFSNPFMLNKHSKSSKNSPKQTGLTSVAQSSNIRDHKDYSSHSSNMQHLVSADITDSDPLNKQVNSISEIKPNHVNENELRSNTQTSIQRLSEKKRKLPMDTLDFQPPVKRTSCNEAMSTSESECNIEDEGPPKDKQLLNLTVCLSHTPITNGSSTNTKSSSLKSVTSFSNSPTTAPRESVDNNSNTFVGKSPFTDLSNMQNGPCPSTFSSGAQTKHIPRLSAPKTDQKITSFENKTINSYGKSRLFSSAERLGGVSRLNSLNQSIQASKPKTGSRLNSINEKVSINTSLNSYSNKPKDRSASVLSEKEQRLEAKRQAFIEQIEKREERLRAFQDAQKQKMEARKKANEERFLAVQQRYQQMIQGNNVKVSFMLFLLVSYLGSRLNSINEKVSINTSLNSYSNKPKDRSASVLSEKEQRLEAKRQAFIEQIEKREERLRAFQDAQKQKMEARKKANEERFLAVQQRYQQMIQGNNVKENSSVTSMQPNNIGAKPLQITTLPKKCVVNLNPLDHNTLKVQNKPATAIKQPQPESCQKSQPVSKSNTIQPLKQSQTQEKVVVAQKVSLISSPVVSESFDMSQLNSDSESDDDEPSVKVAAWCRKGNPEMIATMSDVYSNKLRWQNEFLPASMITFDIADVFRNYRYNVRPRTSSGTWNTPPGSSKGSVGRSVLKKILL